MRSTSQQRIRSCGHEQQPTGSCQNLTGKKTKWTLSSHFNHLLRKQRKLCKKSRPICLQKWFNLPLLTENRTFCPKVCLVPEAGPAEAPCTWNGLSGARTSPARVNEQFRGFSLGAESLGEEVGGVKEGVTLYKYQLNENRLPGGPTDFVWWNLLIRYGLVWPKPKVLLSLF